MEFFVDPKNKKTPHSSAKKKLRNNITRGKGKGEEGEKRKRRNVGGCMFSRQKGFDFQFVSY